MKPQEFLFVNLLDCAPKDNQKVGKTAKGIKKKYYCKEHSTYKL